MTRGSVHYVAESAESTDWYENDTSKQIMENALDLIKPRSPRANDP